MRKGNSCPFYDARIMASSTYLFQFTYSAKFTFGDALPSHNPLAGIGHTHLRLKIVSRNKCSKSATSMPAKKLSQLCPTEKSNRKW